MKSRMLFPGAFLLVLLSTAGQVSAQREMPAPGETPKTPTLHGEKPGKGKDAPRKMIREGTTFQGQIVLFREMGQRLSMFTLPENRRCTCLENLALERIVKMIRRTNGSVYWKVDGEYTEYSGENYVRIRRAVLAPPTEIPDHDPAP